MTLFVTAEEARRSAEPCENCGTPVVEISVHVNGRLHRQGIHEVLPRNPDKPLEIRYDTHTPSDCRMKRRRAETPEEQR